MYKRGMFKNVLSSVSNLTDITVSVTVRSRSPSVRGEWDRRTLALGRLH